ncbi:16S rRNA (uracil(1498)-N(3))-methyltransferase [Celerinatantimonas diazotrophica]|uniref:Ribosomal RNA small subunit methyltransferase E n=1 Tax=Celerinatantimonas diazotrophica TaxID=412034 RepID=A0A4R1J912_9GAMM|nr:16S rRNA (uracil(1498)-N(3))-methyltransferase [Celerinatantimonas diazotrophica]TCK46990.1 16S rRNA m(3)U-1498 methyltransferase [Celerinatantimonas diazotrophica]CAG9295758.1 Ribosomal RNA small subunit methyltransferase E [Celerinatantimonas diazotrophica]
MRIPRIYHPSQLATQQQVLLSDDATGHIARVLRLKEGHPVILFCGDGFDYAGEITTLTKRNVEVRLDSSNDKRQIESPLHIHLGQVISRGDKMDFTLQKSVELGVDEITPLLSARCGVKLPPERLEKKRQQWQKIVISACEQCGRAIIPTINPVLELNQWASEQTNELKLNLHPQAPYTIKSIPRPEQGIRLLIGPEGGLSEQEITQMSDLAFAEIQLGPRILRTETAALCAISALQSQFGDLA